MTRHELEKMTVIKLREEAMKYPEISGVHGMKKAELIGTLAKFMGLPEEEHITGKTKIKKVVSKEILKKQIKELKEKRIEAIKVKDNKSLKRVRKRIKKVKRSLRALSAA